METSATSTKLMPFGIELWSEEIERAFLGSILISPMDIEQVTHIAKDDFFLRRHQLIWESMIHLYSKGIEIDNITLTDSLRAQNLLNDIGGGAYLTLLMSESFNSLNLLSYARQLEEWGAKRRLLKTATDIIEGIKNGGGKSSADILSDAKQGIEEVEHKSQNDMSKARWLGEYVAEAFAEIKSRIDSPGERPLGLPTGIKYIDDVVGGIVLGQISILAGGEKVGKSTLALNIALNVAKWLMIHHPRKVVRYVTLEMGGKQHAYRYLARSSDINLQFIMRGQDDRHQALDADHLQDKVDDASFLPLLIDDKGTQTVDDMLRRMRRDDAERGVQTVLLIVDHLDLVAGSERDSQHERVSKTVFTLNQYAQTYKHLAVLALSQINRQAKTRQENAGDREIYPSDCLGSGAIEQCAYSLFAIWNLKVYDSKPKVPLFLKIALHRNGPTGKKLCLMYDKPRMNIEDYEPKRGVSRDQREESSEDQLPIDLANY